MKVVICTQYRENYGTESAPHWKFKGGSTYVVEGLTTAQAARAATSGCPTLTSLIAYRNPMAEESVIDVSVVEDDAVICDSWESVTKLHYVGGQWHATEVIENDEYGYMRKEIARKVHTWILGKDIDSHRVVYVMRSGGELTHAQLEQKLAA
jgi:hypothetical protein